MHSISSNRPVSSDHSNVRQTSKLVVAAKLLLATAIVVGLAVAAYFAIFGVLELIAAGAAFWKIGLLSVGAVAASTGLVGSIYFCGKHRMLEDTGHNARDVRNFLIGSLA